MALLTEQLAEFVAMAGPQDLPEDVLDRAVLSTLDCIAAAVGGMPTANAASMRAYSSGVILCCLSSAGVIVAGEGVWTEV